MASFSGDSNNAPAATVCTDEPVAITKASPTISTQLNASSITVGGSDYDTAALAGFAPGGTGGTVTYTVYTDSGCTTGGQPAGTVDIDESTGVATQSNSVSFTAAGTVSWEAVFDGDSNNGTAASACEPLVVSKASPTVVTILNASAITVGGTDYDTSALSNFAPGGTSGTVTYTVYSDNSCTTAVQSGGTVNINEANGAVPQSNILTFNTAGTFYWQATFSGDSNNAGASSSCTSEVVNVAKASPTLGTTLNANPITVGGSDFDTAALSGFASGGTGGTVTYTAYTNSTCTAGAQTGGTVNINESTGASTSNTLTFNTAGTVSWNAVFNGDSNNNGTAASACEPLVVSKAVTTISTTLQSNAIPVGGTDYDTSALSNFAPGGTSGTVTYTVYSDNSCTTAVQSGGTVNINEANGAVPQSNILTFNTAGTFYWQAKFSGDSNNAGQRAAAATSEVVNVAKASPTLGTTLNANPIAVGGSDFDTAALTGFASGGTGGTVTYTAYTSSTAAVRRADGGDRARQ